MLTILTALTTIAFANPNLDAVELPSVNPQPQILYHGVDVDANRPARTQAIA